LLSALNRVLWCARRRNFADDFEIEAAHTSQLVNDSVGASFDAIAVRVQGERMAQWRGGRSASEREELMSVGASSSRSVI
jgi:hypothetical protein